MHTLTVVKIGRNMTFALTSIQVGLPDVNITGSFFDPAPADLPAGSVGLLANGISTIAFDNFFIQDAPLCTDGLLNGDEEGPDCGGSCPSACSYPITLTHDWASSGLAGWEVLNWANTADQARYWVETDGKLWQRVNHGTDYVPGGQQCMVMWQGHMLMARHWGRVYDFDLDVIQQNTDNDGAGIVFRYIDADNFYFFITNNEDCCVSIRRRRAGIDTMLPITGLPAGTKFGFYSDPVGTLHRPCPPPLPTRRLTLAPNPGINRILTWCQPRLARPNPNPAQVAKTGYAANGVVNSYFYTVTPDAGSPAGTYGANCGALAPGSAYNSGGGAVTWKFRVRGNLFQWWSRGVLMVEAYDIEDGSAMAPGQIGFWGQRCSGQSWTNPSLTIVSREPTAPGHGRYGVRTTLPLRSLPSALPQGFFPGTPPFAALGMQGAISNPSKTNATAPLVMHLDSAGLLPSPRLPFWADQSGVGNNAFAFTHYNAPTPPSVTSAPNEPPAVNFASGWLTAFPKPELMPLYRGLSVIVAFKPADVASAYVVGAGMRVVPQGANRPGYKLVINPTTPLTATFTAAGHRPTTPLAQRSYGVPIESVAAATFPVALNTISVVGFRLQPVLGLDQRPPTNRGVPAETEPVFNATLWMPSAQRSAGQATTWLNSSATGLSVGQLLLSYAPISVEGSETYFQLGADESGTGSRFSGSIFEVAVFAGPLADEDMQRAVDHVGSKLGLNGCARVDYSSSGATPTGTGCDTARPGDVCLLSCPTGTVAAGGSASMTCLASGTWSSPAPLVCRQACAPWQPAYVDKGCKQGPTWDFAQAGPLGVTSAVSEYRLFKAWPDYGAPLWFAAGGVLNVSAQAGSTSTTSSPGGQAVQEDTALSTLRLLPGSFINSVLGGIAVAVTATQLSGGPLAFLSLRFREVDASNFFFLEMNGFVSSGALLGQPGSQLPANGGTLRLGKVVAGIKSFLTCAGSRPNITMGVPVRFEVQSQGNAVATGFPAGSIVVLVDGAQYCSVVDTAFPAGSVALVVAPSVDATFDDFSVQTFERGACPAGCNSMYAGSACTMTCLPGFAPAAPQTVSCNSSGVLVNTYKCVVQPPVFLNQTLSVAELVPSGTTVGKVNATAASPVAKMLYTILSGNAGNTFSVDACSGLLTVNAPLLLDFENIAPGRSSFALQLSVAVFGFEAESTSVAWVTVQVLNANDPATILTSSLTVSEDASVGSLVGRVVTFDPEGDAVSLSIGYGNSAGVFSIDALTGFVSVAKAGVLDFETAPLMRIVVTATDPRTPSITSQGIVDIYVTDANDAPKVTVPAGASFLQWEIPAGGLPAGAQIGLPLASTDQDAGDTATWSYSHNANTSSLATVSPGGLVLNIARRVYSAGTEYIKDQRIVYDFEEMLVTVRDSAGAQASAVLRIYALANASTTNPIVRSMTVIPNNPADGTGSFGGVGATRHVVSTQGLDLVEFLVDNLPYKASTHDVKANVTSALTQIGFVSICAWSGAQSASAALGVTVIDSVRCPALGGWGKGYSWQLSLVPKSVGAVQPILAGIYLNTDYNPPQIGLISGVGFDTQSLDTVGGARLRMTGFGFGPTTAFNYVQQKTVSRPLSLYYGSPGVFGVAGSFQYSVLSFLPIDTSTSNDNNRVEFASVPGIGAGMQFYVTLGGQEAYGGPSNTASYALSFVSSVSINGSAAASKRYSLDPKGGVDILQVTGSNFGPQAVLAADKPILYFGPAVEVMPLRFSSVCTQAAGALAHSSMTCPVPAGLGRNLTFIALIGGRAGARSAASVEVSYAPPIVKLVTGAGASKGDTRGGQVIYIDGDFGPFSLSQGSSAPLVTYGPTSNPSLFAATECAMVSLGVSQLGRIECLTGAGAGKMLSVVVNVGGQWGPASNGSSATATVSYAPPSISSFDRDPVLSPGADDAETVGGEAVIVYGSNFGPETIAVNGTYFVTLATLNPAAPLRTVGFPTLGFCQKPTGLDAHATLKCVMTPGAGKALSWVVNVAGQLSASPETTYASPIVSAVTLADNVSPAKNLPSEGGTTLYVQGRYFGPPGSPGPFVSSVYYADASVLDGASGNALQYVPSSFQVVSDLRIKIVTTPGIGAGMRLRLVVADVLSGVSPITVGEISYAPPAVTSISPKTSPTLPSASAGTGTLLTVKGSGFGLLDPTVSHRVLLDGVELFIVSRYPSLLSVVKGNLSAAELNVANHAITCTIPAGVGQQLGVQVVAWRSARPTLTVSSSPALDSPTTWFSYSAPTISTYAVNRVDTGTGADVVAARARARSFFGVNVTLADVREITLRGANFGPDATKSFLEVQAVDSNGLPVTGAPFARSNIAVHTWDHDEINLLTTYTEGFLRINVPGRDPAGVALAPQLSNAILFYDISPSVSGLVGARPDGYSTAGGDIITLLLGSLVGADRLSVTVANASCAIVLDDAGTPATVAQIKSVVIDAQLAARPASVTAADFVWQVKCRLPAGQGSRAPIIIYRDLMPGTSPGVFIRYSAPTLSSVSLLAAGGSSFAATYESPVSIPTLGATMQIAGANFGPCPIVIFGLSRGAGCADAAQAGDSIAVLAASHTSVTAVLPAGWGRGPSPGTTFLVSIVAADQQLSVPTVYKSPSVSSIVPLSPGGALRTTGGTTIVLLGANFASAAAPLPVVAIELPSADATRHVLCTDVARSQSNPHGNITCMLPEGSGLGLAVTVSVADLNATSRGVLSYDAPTLASAALVPRAAWLALAGSNSSSDAAALLSNMSDAGIVAASPGATAVAVPGAGPAMALLTGAAAGGDVIMLSGANFGVADPVNHCAFLAWSFRSTDPARTPTCDGYENHFGEGEVADSSLLFWSHSRIAFSVPPGLGTKDIELSVRGNLLSVLAPRTSAAAARFRYAAPAVARMTIGERPSTTPLPLANTDGGDPAALFGSGFGPAPRNVSNAANRLASEVFVPGLPLAAAPGLPTAALVLAFHRSCVTNAFTLAGFRSALPFHAPPPPGTADAPAATTLLSSCALFDSMSDGLVSFSTQPGIGANRVAQLFVVEDVSRVAQQPGFAAVLANLAAAGSGAVAVPPAPAAPAALQLASAVVPFSYMPPTIQSFNPQVVVLAPAPREDGSFSPTSVTLLGDNFGSSSVAVQVAQGWTPAERAVDGAAGGTKCVGDVVRVAGLDGTTQLVCELASEQMLAGFRNVSIVVAGQAGFASEVAHLVDLGGNRHITFVPLLITCGAGFYAHVNETCLPCPAQYPNDPQYTGAKCPGFVQASATASPAPSFESQFRYPVPLRGWYNLNSSDANTLKWGSWGGADPAASQMLACPDGFQDHGRDVCLAPCDPPESCLGSNICAPGYASKPPLWKCAACDTGFYHRNSECVKCPDSPWALVIGFTLLVAFAGCLGYFLNKKCVNIAVVSNGLDFFQVLAIFASSGVKWPAVIKKLFEILSAFNLNIEIVAPECIVPDLSYKAKFYFIMLLPLSVGCLLGLIFALVWVWKAAVMGQAKKDWFTHRHALAASTLALLYILYLYLTRTVFDVFNCTPTMPPDGALHLAVAGGERCGVPGGTQLTLLPAAVAGLVVYSFGYPGFVFYMLYTNKERIMLDQLLKAKGTGDDKLTNPTAHELRRTFGRSYFQFKPDYCFWILAIILRKFFISITAVVFGKNSSFQMAACLLVMFLAYSAQMMFRPYMNAGEFESVLKAHVESSFTNAVHARIRAQIANIETRGRKKARKNLLTFDGKVDRGAVLGLLTSWLFNYNTIEQLMLFAAVIVCLMGIMYQANSSSSFYPGALDGVTAVVMIDIIVAIVYYFTMLFSEIAILYNEDSNRKRLERAAKERGMKDGGPRSPGALKSPRDAPGDRLVDPASGEINTGFLETATNPLFLGVESSAAGFGESGADAVFSARAPPPPELWPVIQAEWQLQSRTVEQLRAQLVEMRKATAQETAAGAGEDGAAQRSARKSSFAPSVAGGGSSSSARKLLVSKKKAPIDV